MSEIVSSPILITTDAPQMMAGVPEQINILKQLNFKTNKIINNSKSRSNLLFSFNFGANISVEEKVAIIARKHSSNKAKKIKKHKKRVPGQRTTNTNASKFRDIYILIF